MVLRRTAIALGTFIDGLLMVLNGAHECRSWRTIEGPATRVKQLPISTDIEELLMALFGA
jgi:hypothetical protein